MKFNNSHKALAISLLIATSVVLSFFNYSIVKQNEVVAEMLIDISPPDLFNKETEEELEKKNNSEKTNKGYNETTKHKHFAQAFTPIKPPEDYENPRIRAIPKNALNLKEVVKNEGNYTIKNEELTTFKSVNSVIKKQLSSRQKTNTEASANKNSTVTYSLVERTDTALPVPIYLCEANGKIVVNIIVNNNGTVISTSINSASTSTNNCLLKHALDYAKKAHFNTSTKSTQIGTITFNFEGKI